MSSRSQEISLLTKRKGEEIREPRSFEFAYEIRRSELGECRKIPCDIYTSVDDIAPPFPHTETHPVPGTRGRLSNDE